MATSAPNARNALAQPQAIDLSLAMPTIRPFLPSRSLALTVGSLGWSLDALASCRISMLLDDRADRRVVGQHTGKRLQRPHPGNWHSLTRLYGAFPRSSAALLEPTNAPTGMRGPDDGDNTVHLKPLRFFAEEQGDPPSRARSCQWHLRPPQRSGSCFLESCIDGSSAGSMLLRVTVALPPVSTLRARQDIRRNL